MNLWMFAQGEDATSSNDSSSTESSNDSSTEVTVEENATSKETKVVDESLVGLKDTLKKVRRERDDSKNELKRVMTRLEELENKDKSEVEKLQSERDKLANTLTEREAKVRDKAIRSALLTEIATSGARYPDLLVDKLKADAEVDDEYEVTNAKELVEDAKSKYPDLFTTKVEEKRVARADAGAGNSNDTKAKNVEPGFGRLKVAYSEEPPKKRK